jgi:hypothetical protein
MRNALLAAILTAVLPLSAACKTEPAPVGGAPANPSAQAASTGHAPANVTPGSHEDWCGEHQVPESLCTRCNPTLVAAFKATGDWCEEHGLPESQCRICNPDLKIERPPPKAQ